MPTIQREKTAVLSISLPKSLRKRIIQYAKKQDITVSQLIKERLERDLFLQEWDEISKAMAPAFAKLGIKTDADIEKYFG